MRPPPPTQVAYLCQAATEPFFYLYGVTLMTAPDLPFSFLSLQLSRLIGGRGFCPCRLFVSLNCESRLLLPGDIRTVRCETVPGEWLSSLRSPLVSAVCPYYIGRLFLLLIRKFAWLMIKAAADGRAWPSQYKAARGLILRPSRFS